MKDHESATHLLFTDDHGKGSEPMRKGSAENSAERKEIIMRLLRVWDTFPELRLGQLIDNAVMGPIYHLPDQDLIEALEDA